MAERTFTVIEGFLSPEECNKLLEVVLEHATEDPKPNFRGLGLVSKEAIDTGYYPTHLDPDMLCVKIIDKVKEYYLSTYEMYGDFVFSRLFGNVMEEGSVLSSHRDEDAGPTGEFDGKKRSHVCSILLNDDYEGGELLFDDQGVQLKPKPGSLVLFPGYYVSHGVNEITKGSRVNLLVFFYDMLP